MVLQITSTVCVCVRVCTGLSGFWGHTFVYCEVKVVYEDTAGVPVIQN